MSEQAPTEVQVDVTGAPHPVQPDDVQVEPEQPKED